MKHSDLLDQLRVKPGEAPGLDRRDPAARLGADGKAAGLERLAELVERLGVLHNRLYAEAKQSLLVVPADHNWSRNLCVAEVLVDALERLDPQLPTAEAGVENLSIA